jgi:hypothetical protein
MWVKVPFERSCMDMDVSSFEEILDFRLIKKRRWSQISVGISFSVEDLEVYVALF